MATDERHIMRGECPGCGSAGADLVVLHLHLTDPGDRVDPDLAETDLHLCYPCLERLAALHGTEAVLAGVVEAVVTAASLETARSRRRNGE